MSHPHKIIRDKVAEMMQPLAGDYNIFNSRILNIRNDELPALVVYSGKEVVVKTPSFDYERSLQIFIVGYATGVDDFEVVGVPIPIFKTLDDKLDNIKEAVENIFLTKRQTLETVVYSFNYVGLNVEFDKQAEDLHGIVTMEYLADFHLNFPDVP